MAGRGFLRYWVLWRLAEAPRTGYGLAKELKLRPGWRPCPGSLCPLLNTLSDLGLIEPVREKRPLWRLTPRGQAEWAQLENRTEGWNTWVALLPTASSDLSGLPQFFKLAAQAAVRGKPAEPTGLLPRCTAELEDLLGGESHGSGGR